MAVQQNKKSPSKRGMHRAHDFLTNPPWRLSRPPEKRICATTSARAAFTVAAKLRAPKASNTGVTHSRSGFPTAI